MWRCFFEEPSHGLGHVISIYISRMYYNSSSISDGTVKPTLQLKLFLADERNTPAVRARNIVCS